MKWTRRIVNAIRRDRAARPKQGQLVFPRREDTLRDYPSAGLTPSRLISILKEADAGSLETAMQLFEEMEEKDPHLFSVANTRRLAFSRLNWEVVSAAEVQRGVDRSMADAAMEHCADVLSRIESFDEILQHLSLAIGRNISVAEIVWDSAGGSLQPIELRPVDFTRLVFDDQDGLRVLTEDEPRSGIELPPHKFIVHTPHSVGGHPQRGGLLRVTAMVYLAKNMALKDWMIFAEVFGMPVRIARYDPSATAEEKRELLHMLESLGSNAAGVFSRAVDLQIVEANRGRSGPPFQDLIEYLNREMSKAWLGQTLTTDVVGQSGSIAASKVHETVRQDIVADDVRKEGRTIRRDLLTPIARFRFGPGVPVPFFRRKLQDRRDVTVLADVLDTAVNRLGLSVGASWAREALGVPPTTAGEALLPGVPV